MTIEQLNSITAYLKEKIWRNPDVMYMQSDNQGCDSSDLVDIISSLHNLLYEVVTGNRYNYAFHWCNKIGAWTDDSIFDKIISESEESENDEP